MITPFEPACCHTSRIPPRAAAAAACPPAVSLSCCTLWGWEGRRLAGSAPPADNSSAETFESGVQGRLLTAQENTAPTREPMRLPPRTTHRHQICTALHVNITRTFGARELQLQASLGFRPAHATSLFAAWSFGHIMHDTHHREGWVQVQVRAAAKHIYMDLTASRLAISPSTEVSSRVGDPLVSRQTSNTVTKQQYSRRTFHPQQTTL